MKLNMRCCLENHSQRAAAAIEYIIVSLFAAVIALTAITYVGKMVKKKVEEIADKMGMEGDDFEIGIDGL